MESCNEGSFFMLSKNDLEYFSSNNFENNYIVNTLILNYQCLLVLHLNGLTTKELPTSLLKSGHLRYLDLS